MLKKQISAKIRLVLYVVAEEKKLLLLLRAMLGLNVSVLCTVTS